MLLHETIMARSSRLASRQFGIDRRLRPPRPCVVAGPFNGSSASPPTPWSFSHDAASLHRRRGGEPRVGGSTAVDAIRHMGGGDAGRMIRSVNSLRDVGLDSRRDGHGIKVGSLELAIGDLF